VNPALVAGLLSLTGVVVGFGGAVLVESLRGRHERTRDAIAQQQRFQIETLTRLQEVAKDMHMGMTLLFESADSRLKGAGGMPPQTSAEIVDNVLRSACELSMLTSRVHSEVIALFGGGFLEISTTVTYDYKSREELRQARDAVNAMHGRLQYLAGQELVEMLGGQARPAIDKLSYPPRDHQPPDSA
jgi:hypothetical protein